MSEDNVIITSGVYAGIGEAPDDGKAYVRKNKLWTESVGGIKSTVIQFNRSEMDYLLTGLYQIVFDYPISEDPLIVQISFFSPTGLNFTPAMDASMAFNSNQLTVRIANYPPEYLYRVTILEIA